MALNLLTHKRTLSYAEARAFLKRSGVELAKSVFVKDPAEAVAATQKIGFPVVLKIASPDVLHKTDVGGVATNLHNPEDVRQTADKMRKSVRGKKPSARIEGFHVEKQLRGIETIIGVKNDAQFGPVLAFGLGGVYVEIYKDVAFRVIPITIKDAKDMIEEIRGHEILRGVRGAAAIDFAALQRALMRVSEFAWKNRNILEMDINPLIVNEEGAVAADARVIITE